MPVRGRRRHPRFSVSSSDGVLSVLREVSVRQASERELVVIGHEPREVGEVLTLETFVNGKLASTAVRVVTSIPVVRSGTLFHELRLVHVSDDIGGEEEIR